MGKKIKLVVLTGFISIFLLLLIITYWFCAVPIESRLEIHTVWGYGNEIIAELSNELNGEITSRADWAEVSQERYYLSVHAPLKDILVSKQVLENPHVIKMYYEWEMTPFLEDWPKDK